MAFQSRSFSSLLSTSILPLLLAACGGGQGNPDPGDPVAAYHEMIRTACERQAECGYPILNQGKSVDECLSLQEPSTDDVLPTLGDGAVILREDRLRACAAALAEGSCQEVASHGFEIDAACTTFWEGTLGEGEDCRGGVASDCGEGLTCVFEGQSCPGTCAPVVPPCVEGSCEAGSFCDENARCVPQAAAGAACGNTIAGALHENPCVEGAYCKEGACAARIGAGEACPGSSESECIEEHTCQCAGEGCSGGTICAPAPAAGEPCNWSGGCAEGRFCDFDTGTCDDRRDEGEACPASWGACKPGLECAAGTCVEPGSRPSEPLPLLDSGADCSDGGLCPLGETCLCAEEGCDGNSKQCRPGPKLGESCEEAYQANFSPFVCGEGLCDVFETRTCVSPAPAGEPCTGTFTLACASGVCAGGVCASLDQTRCQP